MVRCFEPRLDLPAGVKVKVVIVEVSFSLSFSLNSVSNTICGIVAQFWFTSIYIQVTKDGMKSEEQTEVLTVERLVDFFPVLFFGWEKKQLRVHLISFGFFNSKTGSDSLSNTESEYERPEVESLWHSECHPNTITATNDLMHFSVRLNTQGKIPSRNCWSLRLTRSTQWRRYSKYMRSSAKVVLLSPHVVRESVMRENTLTSLYIALGGNLHYKND